MRPALTNALTNAIREALNYSSTNLEHEPAIDYVYRLDGLAKYYQFSEVRTITGDFEVSFDVLIGDDKPVALLGGDSNVGAILFDTGRFKIRDTSNVFCSTQEIYSNDGGTEYSILVSVSSGNVKFYVNGVPQELNVFIDSVKQPAGYETSSFSGLFLNYLASLDSGKLILNGYIKNFKLTESGVNTITLPLTNKAQGATQLPTVGNVSATIVNYTDTWEEV